jgi:hypothetical protein
MGDGEQAMGDGKKERFPIFFGGESGAVYYPSPCFYVLFFAHSLLPIAYRLLF